MLPDTFVSFTSSSCHYLPKRQIKEKSSKPLLKYYAITLIVLPGPVGILTVMVAKNMGANSTLITGTNQLF